MSPEPLPTGEPPSPFQNLLGYELVAWREGYAELVLEIRPEHLNRAGVVHGGVYTALLDTVMGFAGTWTPHVGRMRSAVTLQLSTCFVGQASRGLLRAVGQVAGGGRRIFFTRGEVFDQAGRLLAFGEGTFRLRSGSEEPEGVPIPGEEER